MSTEGCEVLKKVPTGGDGSAEAEYGGSRTRLLSMFCTSICMDDQSNQILTLDLTVCQGQ